VFVELLAALLGAIVVASLLFGSTLAAAGAALAALVALVIMALARAWFLAAVVKRIEKRGLASTDEPELCLCAAKR
jgi:Na+-driven multidrug efflux pump